MPPTLSIVLPTCNRADLLEQTLHSLNDCTRRSYEIIVVNGASTDHTRDVLAGAAVSMGERLKVINEEKREGFVKGTNKGFRAATGTYMTWLNDDARPLPGCLDLAIDQFESAPADVAFVAMFHRWQSQRNIAYETADHWGRPFRLCHVRGTLYANFPLGLRSTFEALDYFDERYFVRGADPDLSLKAWDAGYRVIPACGCMIDHDEVEDDRRAADLNFGQADNDKLFAKWNLPARNPTRNDFDPGRPCTLLTQLAHAA